VHGRPALGECQGMICCSAPSRQRRRAPRPAEPATAAVSQAGPPSRLTRVADGLPASSEHERHILVQFPGMRGEFREVRWSEDPSRPMTLDGIKDLLREADPGGGCAGSSDFDVLDDDGDAILAPSTWPPRTRVIVSLEGRLNATFSPER
jgi:hypothetical protein